MKNSANYIKVAAWAGIVVCIGEFLTIFIFGAYYPGYSQLKDTMSMLGTSESPVSVEISTWWVIMGLSFIFFATGFYKAFRVKGRYAGLAAVLIGLYGFGEGIGSGAFKADRIANEFTPIGRVHEVFGIVGVLAILLFPFIMQKLIPKSSDPGFYRFSQIIFICGILTVLLFLLRYLPDPDNFFTIYKGLWQRLFMLNTYIYLTTIAILMLRGQKKL